MPDRIRRVALAVTTAALFGAGCDHAQGPSLSATIEAQKLVPTSIEGNAATVLPACCCRVQGTVRNTSSIPVNVSLRFTGSSATGGNLGVAVDYVQNLPAGAAGAYDAAGLLAACSQVSKVDARLEVLGVYQP